MDDAFGVQRLYALRDRSKEYGDCAILPRQVHGLQKLHYDVGSPFNLSRAKKARKCGMSQLRQQFGLAPEALHVRHLVADENLKRALKRKRQMHDAIYLGASAAPKECDYAPACEKRPGRKACAAGNRLVALKEVF